MGLNDITRIALLGVLSFLLVTLNNIQPCNADDKGMEWLKRIEDAERIDHSQSIVTQVITTSTGSERTLKLKMLTAEGGDLALMEYLEPARVKGDKILQRDGGDNIWYYMKRRDVTRHFTGSAKKQKVMGSDFSYEDLATGDLTDDYIADLLDNKTADGIKCIRLRCVPTDKGPSYDHIIIWAGIEDSLIRLIEYYDEEGLLKTLHIDDFQQVEGRKVAMKLQMINAREDSHTIMNTESITFDFEPDLSLFTKKHLSRR